MFFCRFIANKLLNNILYLSIFHDFICGGLEPEFQTYCNNTANFFNTYMVYDAVFFFNFIYGILNL